MDTYSAPTLAHLFGFEDAAGLLDHLLADHDTYRVLRDATDADPDDWDALDVVHAQAHA